VSETAGAAEIGPVPETAGASDVGSASETVGTAGAVDAAWAPNTDGNVLGSAKVVKDTSQAGRIIAMARRDVVAVDSPA
jgi:hypothetical protein